MTPLSPVVELAIYGLLGGVAAAGVALQAQLVRVRRRHCRDADS